MANSAETKKRQLDASGISLTSLGRLTPKMYLTRLMEADEANRLVDVPLKGEKKQEKKLLKSECDINGTKLLSR